MDVLNLTSQMESIQRRRPSCSSVKSAHGQRRSGKKSMKSSTSVERDDAACGFPSLAAPLSDRD